MKTVYAVYQDGVFRPTERLELPESCEVEFEPRIVKATGQKPGLDEVYEFLDQRFRSGEHDVAERHNEHQP